MHYLKIQFQIINSFKIQQKYNNCFEKQWLRSLTKKFITNRDRRYKCDTIFLKLYYFKEMRSFSARKQFGIFYCNVMTGTAFNPIGSTDGFNPLD